MISVGTAEGEQPAVCVSQRRVEKLHSVLMFPRENAEILPADSELVSNNITLRASEN